jgi:calcium-dependent protein kinase
MNEIWILRHLHHPNIITLHEVYESEKYVHLVLEYLKGGELFEVINTKGSYSENDAAKFTRQLMDAIAYCASKNVIHRDIKPENIILT